MISSFPTRSSQPGQTIDPKKRLDMSRQFSNFELGLGHACDKGTGTRYLDIIGLKNRVQTSYLTTRVKTATRKVTIYHGTRGPKSDPLLCENLSHTFKQKGKNFDSLHSPGLQIFSTWVPGKDSDFLTLLRRNFPSTWD